MMPKGALRFLIPLLYLGKKNILVGWLVGYPSIPQQIDQMDNTRQD